MENLVRNLIRHFIEFNIPLTMLDATESVGMFLHMVCNLNDSLNGPATAWGGTVGVGLSFTCFFAASYFRPSSFARTSFGPWQFDVEPQWF